MVCTPGSMVLRMIAKVVRIISWATSISLPAESASQSSRVRAAAAIMAGRSRSMRSWRKIGAAARRCQRQRAPSAVRMASPSAGPSARRFMMPLVKLSASSSSTWRISSGAMTNSVSRRVPAVRNRPSW